MKFLVEWEDYETGKQYSEVVEFEDWIGRATLDGEEVGPVLKVTAREWAEDWAYAAADKGYYTLKQL